MAENQPANLGRSDYLRDSDYFMAAAILSAQRSKDPNTQVGACIVKENEIVAMGYNRMPNGGDGELPWTRSDDESQKRDLDKKYVYVCHAELNSIINKSNADVRGCTMYVTLFPCNECAKLIIRAGLKKVVYLSDKYHDRNETIASKEMLDLADIPYMQFTRTRRGRNETTRNEIVINLTSNDNP